jgi:hypothetical protein
LTLPARVLDSNPVVWRFIQEGCRVTAPKIKHGDWEDNYDDPSHPIPSIDALDIEAVKKTGGSDLVIMIASPLSADQRSQHRLLDKSQIYLKYLKTPEFQLHSGIATPENTSIIIRIHPGSDAAILELIEKCKPWVQANAASLKLEILDQGRH